MLILENIDKSVADCLKTYAACSSEQQAILRTLAAIYQEINQTTLNRILERLNAMNVFIESSVEPKLDSTTRNNLIAKGLIVLYKGGKSNFHLNPMLQHVLMLEAIKHEELEGMLQEIQIELPLSGRFDLQLRSPMQKARYIRQCFYTQRYDELARLLKREPKERAMKLDEAKLIATACFYPYDPDYIKQLPGFVIVTAFAWMFEKVRADGQDNKLLRTWLADLHQALKGEEIGLLLAQQYLRCCELKPAQSILAKLSESIDSLMLLGWLSVMQNKWSSALAHFDKALAIKQKANKNKRAYIDGLPGIFYALALLKTGYGSDANRLNQLLSLVTHLDKDKPGLDSDKYGFLVLAQQARCYIGQTSDVWFIDINNHYFEETEGLRLGILLSSLCYCWQDKAIPGEYYDKLMEYFDEAISANQLFLAHPLARILFQSKKPYDNATRFLRSYKHQAVDLYALIKPKEPWQQVLDQLIALQSQPEDAQQQGLSRLVWWIYREQFPHKIEAREQKRTKKGWTKGRVVPLKRFKEELDTLENLTTQDHRLIDQISSTTKESYYSFDTYESYALTGFDGLKGCVGHPNVYFADNPGEAIDIVESEPELVITESKSGFDLFMPGVLKDHKEQERSYNLIELGNHRYGLVKFNQKHRLIADIIGEKGLTIPKKAKAQVLKSVQSVAPFLNIHSDIAELCEVDTGFEPVSADITLYINIQPSGNGLSLECRVQPLGINGPAQWPGHGNPMVMAQVDGAQLKTTRDLNAEQQLLESLKQQCPPFDHMSAHILHLDELEDALNCLEMLQSIETPKVTLQWPKGKAIKLTSRLGGDKMKLSVKQQQQWLKLEGQLSIDEKEVIELTELLRLMDKAQGRFIPLGNDKFLALTEQLKQQLDDIAALTIDGQFHQVAAPVMEQAIEAIPLVDSDLWQQQLSKLKSAYRLEVNKPTTLQAQLRDYQLAGFDWAYRLSHWGAGACLADDMGLGKTLQSLAVILKRAGAGPTLVLAPVSVCFNWQQEAIKFAPSLNVKVLADGDKKLRRQWLKKAAELDLIICSYGLLQTEFDGLSKVHWHTLIADEAQALKNPQSKRSRLALELQGDFKMITTGTPIENNLSELWSLFRFINPGLLGTQEQFIQKYASPLESMPGTEAARQASVSLRKLIAPFILRRLKSEVLTELPSRTEINLGVEHSVEEAHFYEALRREALDAMMRTDNKAGNKRFQILSELMRLRRACCHPSLVSEDVDIPSSKLKVFDDLVDELIQGGHKALVFSQFVGHLALLKRHLDDKGIDYQYLDGSTPANARKKAVNAFQAGQGDLFLISLKAGGSGLNLTAADYVIHMDPWWNPAVEDQASDRAYRMGQTRPVTIYRLITQNTIEEKIMQLHQQKRDLADSLLEGTDSSGNLSYEDMLALLTE